MKVPPFNPTSDLDIFARTVWGEARGEGLAGMAAVANVVMNRAHDPKRRFGDGVQAVCLKPWQFSCWNPHDPNHALLTDPLHDPTGPAWDEAKVMAMAAINGTLPDRTHGATHYVVSTLSPKPGWEYAMQPTAVIGHHTFFREAQP